MITPPRAAETTEVLDIGIIGGGGAGLTAAWLLSDRHRVTVFEKQNRLGGHAHTVDIERDGERIAIDAGFDFFSPRVWPTFFKLLNILGVPTHRYPATVTLYPADNSRVYTMPLVRDRRMNWSLFRPQTLSKMLQFQWAVQRAKPLVQSANTAVTVEEFTEGLNLSRAFKDEFFYPLLLSIWCVELEECKQFAVYDGLKYIVDTENLSKVYHEVVGGTRTYIDALVRALPQAKIKTSAGISAIARRSSRYIVADESGESHEFDHLILATNARDAAHLITELEGKESLRRDLTRFEYFKTTIAVHGDTRLMPANKKDWSVLNLRHSGAHSSLTVWKNWKSKTPVFKSWVTYEPQLPEPLYTSTVFDHPKVNRAYFEAQRAIATQQGRDNLWLAGVYTHDIDSHESAVLSAVKIAQRLTPQSLNLNRLMTP